MNKGKNTTPKTEQAPSVIPENPQAPPDETQAPPPENEQPPQAPPDETQQKPPHVFNADGLVRSGSRLWTYTYVGAAILQAEADTFFAPAKQRFGMKKGDFVLAYNGDTSRTLVL
jgi:hypothetical protein